MIKDKYGNNLRRQDRVKDLRPDSGLEGEVIATAGSMAIVIWDPDGTEESVLGEDLVLKNQRFGGRRKG